MGVINEEHLLNKKPFLYQLFIWNSFKKNPSLFQIYTQPITNLEKYAYTKERIVMRCAASSDNILGINILKIKMHLNVLLYLNK